MKAGMSFYVMIGKMGDKKLGDRPVIFFFWRLDVGVY